MTKKLDTSRETEHETVRRWHQEYQSLDELVAKLDRMRWELERLRHLVEQKMADIDQFFNPYPE